MTPSARPAPAIGRPVSDHLQAPAPRGSDQQGSTRQGARPKNGRRSKPHLPRFATPRRSDPQTRPSASQVAADLLRANERNRHSHASNNRQKNGCHVYETSAKRRPFHRSAGPLQSDPQRALLGQQAPRPHAQRAPQSACSSPAQGPVATATCRPDKVRQSPALYVATSAAATPRSRYRPKPCAQAGHRLPRSPAPSSHAQCRTRPAHQYRLGFADRPYGPLPASHRGLHPFWRSHRSGIHLWQPARHLPCGTARGSGGDESDRSPGDTSPGAAQSDLSHPLP